MPPGVMRWGEGGGGRPLGSVPLCGGWVGGSDNFDQFLFLLELLIKKPELSGFFCGFQSGRAHGIAFYAILRDGKGLFQSVVRLLLKRRE